MASHSQYQNGDSTPDSDDRRQQQFSHVKGQVQPREKICAAMEQQYVHDVYDKTAHHFVGVKYKAWPKVKQFLMNLSVGSVVADVGCGNGKYLNINKDIVVIGCDHSTSLVSMAQHGGRHVLVCDNLHLPFRDQCFDAVISVGVIHHFTTPSRRAKAIRELARVLRPGGKVMICVWAMEQKHRRFKSQDVLVPWHLKLKHQKQGSHKHNQRKALSTGSYNILGCSDDDDDDESGDDNVFEASSPPPRTEKRMYLCKDITSKSSGSQSIDKLGRSNSSHKQRRELMHKRLSIGKRLSLATVSSVTPKSSTFIESPETGNDFESSNLSQKGMHEEEMSGSLPRTIKAKFFNFIGVEADLVKERPDQSSKHSTRMIEKTINHDHEMGCHSGENIPLSFAMEGFAVREFPGSSCRMEPTKPKSLNEAAVSTEKVQPNATIFSNEMFSRPLIQNSPSASKKMDISNFSEHSNGMTSGEPILHHTTDISTGQDSSSEYHNYREKCSEWLMFGTSEDAALRQIAVTQAISSKDTTISHSPKLINNSLRTKELSNNERMMPNDSDEWATLTVKAIEHIQNQVRAGDTLLTAKSRARSPLNSPCVCRSSSRVGERSVENIESKLVVKVRNCSESSISSVSSDTESNPSDIEDVSLCSVCHSDYVSEASHDGPQTRENGNVQQDSLQFYHDSQLYSTSSNVQDIAELNLYHTTTQNKQDHAQNISGCSNGIFTSSSPDRDQSLTEDMSDHAKGNAGRLCKNSVNAHDKLFGIISGSGFCHISKFANNIKVNRGSIKNINLHNGHQTDSQVFSVPHKDHSGDSSKIHRRTNMEQPAVTDFRTSNQNAGGAHKRFYHVFREKELDNLIQKRVESLQIVQSFYDHANWCVIAEKISTLKT